jgi:hypothetical protein
MTTQDLSTISSLLDTVGARLARRQVEPDADITILDAYASLLAARFELAPHVTVMPTPHLDDVVAEPRTVADDLFAAWSALRDYAFETREDDGLACARAATYVDDARRRILSAST